MRFVIVILLVVLVCLAIIGLIALMFFVGYRRLAAQKPKHSRYGAWRTDRCQHVPGHVYKRPDPMIYCQQYQMSRGLAVTWDNPDIHLELGGVLVDSHDLKPSTTYDVIARIWNNSLDAVVVGMPVAFSFLTFGIGTTKTAIATTPVDIGAKGTPQCPAFARVQWTTPAVAGHYCLIVEFIWADDANPFNNVGQHNTDVKPLNSPHARFKVPVRNDARARREIALRVDSYTPKPLRSCAILPIPDNPRPSRSAIERRMREIAAETNAALFPDTCRARSGCVGGARGAGRYYRAGRIHRTEDLQCRRLRRPGAARRGHADRDGVVAWHTDNIRIAFSPRTTSTRSRAPAVR
jgi:hypothetical protein